MQKLILLLLLSLGLIGNSYADIRHCSLEEAQSRGLERCYLTHEHDEYYVEWKCKEGYIIIGNGCIKEGELPQEVIEKEIAEFEEELAHQLALDEAIKADLFTNPYADDAEAKELDIEDICGPYSFDLQAVKASVEHLEVETKTHIKQLEVERKTLIKQLEELRIENNKNLSDINNVKLNIYLLSLEIDEAGQSLEDLQEDFHSQQESLELCKQDPEAWLARIKARLQKQIEDWDNVKCHDCDGFSNWGCNEGYIRKGNSCVKE